MCVCVCVCVLYRIFFARTNAAFIISLHSPSLAVFLGRERAPSPDQRSGTVFSVCTSSGHITDWLKHCGCIHWNRSYSSSSRKQKKTPRAKNSLQVETLVWLICVIMFCVLHPVTALLTFVCVCLVHKNKKNRRVPRLLVLVCPFFFFFLNRLSTVWTRRARAQKLKKKKKVQPVCLPAPAVTHSRGMQLQHRHCDKMPLGKIKPSILGQQHSITL